MIIDLPRKIDNDFEQRMRNWTRWARQGHGTVGDARWRPDSSDFLSRDGIHASTNTWRQLGDFPPVLRDLGGRRDLVAQLG